jgi:hypothetical protein
MNQFDETSTKLGARLVVDKDFRFFAALGMTGLEVV